MSRYGKFNRDHRGTFAATIPPGRVLKINSSELFEIAGESDANALAVSPGEGVQGPSEVMTNHAIFLSAQGVVDVEAADTIVAGDVVFQAANGKCQQGGGTLRLGVAITSASAGGLVEIVPSR